MKNEETKNKETVLPIPSKKNGQHSTLPMSINTTHAEGKLVNTTSWESLQSVVANYIKAPFNVPTPKEKVKKRPDGYDYVESSFMDSVTKDFMPLYAYSLLHISMEFGWINVIVSLEDRITGNIELGAGAARIQIKREAEAPNFRDIIDMGNNLKSALTQAIKNAQSRFGVSADVYGKREELPTQDERTRFNKLKSEIEEISFSKAKLFEEQWNSLGTGYSDLLDRWSIFIKRSHNQSANNTNKNVNI